MSDPDLFPALDCADGVASHHSLFNRWIAGRYPTPESAKLKCAEATAAMVDAFPTLRRVRGHAMVGTVFRPHWWCITPEGEIIDPTAHQWESPPVFYNAIPEDAEEPCGKCIYCGDLLYRSRGADSYLCENCKPNEETELAINKTWDLRDVPGWLEYIREAWNHHYGRMWEEGGMLKLATGGWSGNEAITHSMRDNYILWSLLWESSHRGGLEVLRMPNVQGLP